MTLESLRITRNMLLRSAVLCYAFLILSALIWLPLSETWTGLTSNWYHITPERVRNIVVDFLTVAKFYAIFVLLTPGLALHWTIKREESRKAKGLKCPAPGDGTARILRFDGSNDMPIPSFMFAWQHDKAGVQTGDSLLYKPMPAS